MRLGDEILLQKRKNEIKPKHKTWEVRDNSVSRRKSYQKNPLVIYSGR
jgi:hypothetical protein